ncbi:hypothetical protein TNIN_456191 [Trichonephila inaurata madagascariensis]|uniref:Uncharacterized protein n=1 Tax=Trichonephila inaurata madagascariensis TaxID=2747483 RepID=A0A8X6YND6_9ARAC|nr:hypothetical protein TNIN_456191 [Trichonephila inaurata madagascariensis]
MPDSVKCIVIVSEEHLDKITAMADKIVEMAPRTIDAAAVQKDSLGVDELLSKLVTLEDQLVSLKLQQKVRSSRSHHHQRSRSRSKSLKAPKQFLGKILLLLFPIREEVPPWQMCTAVKLQ